MSNAITIPELFCPFTPQINPLEKEVEMHTNNWSASFELHPGPAVEEYRASRFSAMTSRFYPTAALDRLCLANDVYVLFFSIDDAFDHQTDKHDIIHNRKNLEQFMAACMSVLGAGRAYTVPNGGPILAALTDVWKRLKDFSTAAWQAIFINDIRILFDAILWQFDNAAQGRIPAVDEYIRMRPFIGGAHMAASLIEVAEEVYLPDHMRKHSTVQNLSLLCGHLGCWANDLFSLSKELEHSDMHNLVMVLKQAQHLSLNEAIKLTVGIHDREMKIFARLSNNLPDFGSGINEALKRHVFALNCIVRGNIDWSTKETSRYNYAYARKSEAGKVQISDKQLKAYLGDTADLLVNPVTVSDITKN